MNVEIISFSYKVGFPDNYFVWTEDRHGGGHVFDCRCVPNPGRLPEFKEATGLDKGVREFLEAAPESNLFWESTSALATQSVKKYLERDFKFLSIAYGCTGGQHRSVYFADKLAKHLSKTFGDKITVKVRHFNLEKK